MPKIRLGAHREPNSEYLGFPVEGLLIWGRDPFNVSFGAPALAPRCPPDTAARQPIPSDPRCGAMAATTVRLEQTEVIDIVFASPVDKPVIGRLFDQQGVLLGESELVSEEAATPIAQPLRPHSLMDICSSLDLETQGGASLGLEIASLRRTRLLGARPSE